ncbi:MAG: hypothetical protein LC660_12110 [Desulfobacteraceae bacterium]|nr:hypothetical protein [Desulfobacteraceae bacterium]
MSEQSPSTISFIIDKNSISIFSIILQQGFKVFAKVGSSLESMLCDQFALPPEYLSNRIQTIFLDGKPVDDVTSTMITDGATLALSAAMPGLVGATFRSGGALSVFRSSITHREEEEKSNISAQGMITLKLFNLLVSEIGPAFLERGIWVETEIIKNLIEEKKTEGKTVFKSLKVDGREIGPDEFSRLNWNEGQKLIEVTVQIEK